MLKNKLQILLIILLPINFALGVDPEEILKDQNLEDRARVISKQLRCMVCQNEDIDSSNADIAKDLRILVRTQLQKGKTNSEIISYIHSKYGDYVLFNPPVKIYTLLLWLSPLLIFMLLFLKFFRKRS